MSAVVEVLRKARELYAANPSHAPADEEVQDGCVCLLSATSVAVDELGAQVDTSNEYAADRAIRKAIGVHDEWAAVAGWNAEHTTEDALAAFDRAIELELAEAQP